MGKQRPKMPLSQRAKQFMPFAAVAGLDIALRRKEEEIAEAVEKNLLPDPVESVKKQKYK